MISAVLSVGPSRRRTLSAAIALVLACLWIGAPLHAHAAAVSGWHDATPQGCPHKRDQGPCSMCRLAREMALTILAPRRIATLEPSADAPATVHAAQPSKPPRGRAVPRAPPLEAC